MDINFNYKVPGNVLEEEIINNTEPKTLWQKIFLHLKKKGYSVYSVGQKRDKCTDPYIVIKEIGVYGQDGNKVGYKLVDIIIYYPAHSYYSMEFYVEDVKKALKELNIRSTGMETPIVEDKEVNAYTTSIKYQALKTLRRIKNE